MIPELLAGHAHNAGRCRVNRGDWRVRYALGVTEFIHESNGETSAAAADDTQVFVVPMTGPVPHRANPQDAGADLHSAETVTLAPGARALVGTGTAIALPAGTVGLVAPRSGLAAKHGITIVNAPGVIDAGYRGELKVCLLNTDANEPYTINAGDRIAQLLVLPIPAVHFVTVDALPEGERGSAGFGSSGYATASSGNENE